MTEIELAAMISKYCKIIMEFSIGNTSEAKVQLWDAHFDMVQIAKADTNAD